MKFRVEYWGMQISVALVLLFPCAYSSSFNYEINARVRENVKDFLNLISSVASLPTRNLDYDVYNISDYFKSTFLDGSRMFLALKQTYRSSISILQIGFENGLYYALVNNEDLPFSIELDSNNMSTLGYVTVYAMQKNGLPLGPADCAGNPNNCPFPFSCTKRPWYKQGKAALTRIWTKPFLQVQPTSPTVSLVNPVFLNGKFIGNIAANVGLIQISEYLRSSYQNTDRNVFIVDEKYGYLIASSMNASLSNADNVSTISFLYIEHRFLLNLYISRV